MVQLPDISPIGERPCGMMLAPCVTGMADEQWESLAHAIAYPTTTKPTGACKSIVGVWHRGCTGRATATVIEALGRTALITTVGEEVP
jgi:hypothetical protein